MRGIAYSVVFIVLAVPLALLALYFWRRNANKQAGKPSVRKGAGGPQHVPKIVSSSGPSVQIPEAVKRISILPLDELKELLSPFLPTDSTLPDSSEVDNGMLPPLSRELIEGLPMLPTSASQNQSSVSWSGGGGVLSSEPDRAPQPDATFVQSVPYVSSPPWAQDDILTSPGQKTDENPFAGGGGGTSGGAGASRDY